MRRLVLVLGLAACKHHAPAGAGSGSGSAVVDDIPDSWHVAHKMPETIVVTLGKRVAVLDPKGSIVSHPGITPDRAEDAPMDGRLIAWIDGANDDELHLLDLTTGQERWHVTATHRIDSIIFGKQALGALTAEGIELHHLDTGALGYHRQGPQLIDSVYSNGTFVWIDDGGMVEGVDEAKDAQLWTFDTKAGHLPDGSWLHFDGDDIVAVHTLLDLKTGKERPPAAESKRKRAADTSNLLARTNQRTRLISDPIQAHRKVSLIDEDDGILWSSVEWNDILGRAVQFEADGVAITTADSGVVVLDGSTPDVRLLVGFDNRTGHVRYQREIGKLDELIGGIDDCIGFVVRGKAPALQCIDDKTGAVRWEHATQGHGIRGWREKSSWLVASGSPAVLEALDATGKVLWTTTLPETAVDAGSANPARLGIESWERGPGYFVATGPRDVSIVDLASGKLSTLRP